MENSTPDFEIMGRHETPLFQDFQDFQDLQSLPDREKSPLND
jgi:hypothetical protein